MMADPPPRGAEGGVMPGPEPPRRKRFQIHLSTAIVLMFVAGGMLWANLHRQRVPQNPEMDKDINDFDKRAFATIVSKTPRLDIVWTEHYSVTSMGWPCRAVIFNDFSNLCTERADLTIVERTWRVHYSSLWVDIVLAFAALFLVFWVCERLIRRRAAREGT